MKELNASDFLHLEPVNRAYSDLKRLTQKSIALHSRTLVPGLRTAFCTSSPHRIHIFIDDGSPLVSHGAVHELLHAILMEEGYHRMTGPRFDDYLRNTFSNEFQHPEIFRRMDVYGLDMKPYWKSWEPELERGFAEIANNVHAHSGFWEFPQVFTWFFFRQVSTPFLDRYRRLNLVAHDAARRAYEDVKAVGMATAKAHLNCLAIFKDHWYRYSETHLPKDGLQSDLLEAITTSITKPVSEIAETRTEQMIVDFLKTKGYSP